MKLAQVTKKNKYFEFVILIPVYNDEYNIPPLKKQIYKNLKKYNFFICFVDDSNNLYTSLKIKKYFKKNYKILKRYKKENYSVRFDASLAGFKWIVKNIKTKLVVEIDSDLSHHPKDIIKGIKSIKNKKIDLVIASKYKKNSLVKNRKFLRELISKFITLTCKIIFEKKISDYTNTFRFYKISLVKNFIKRKSFYKSPIGHLNNLIYIIKNKFIIAEIPTEYIEKNNNSTIRFKDMTRYFLEFLRCIIANKFNFYKDLN